jgi:hypothetical protein
VGDGGFPILAFVGTIVAVEAVENCRFELDCVGVALRKCCSMRSVNELIYFWWRITIFVGNSRKFPTNKWPLPLGKDVSWPFWTWEEDKIDREKNSLKQNERKKYVEKWGKPREG